VEGHHLALNFVLEDGKIVAATPSFFGANPAEVRQGPRPRMRSAPQARLSRPPTPHLESPTLT
jgi:hypothetical protein